MPAINITKRIKTENGWRFAPVMESGNGRLKPDFVLVDGKQEHHPEGNYYIDYYDHPNGNGKRVRVRLAAGKTAAEAQGKAVYQQNQLAFKKAATAAGVALPEPGVDGRSLKNAVMHYLAKIESDPDKKPRTHVAYKLSLEYFLESCQKTNLEDIVKDDLLNFKTFMKKKNLSKRTQWNKFCHVIVFLNANKVRDLDITKNDWPKFDRNEPVEVYSPKELDTFFAACTAEERVYFEFLFKTGMRAQELMHVSWSDIDFTRSIVEVRENKKFNFEPKTYTSRSIPVLKETLEPLKKWKKCTDPKCGLVFPTSECKPKGDFLQICKAVARRAGLDPDKFWLHKFRATRATQLLREGFDIKSVSRILGHNDIKSTMRYLAAQNTDALQEQMEAIEARKSKAKTPAAQATN